MEQPTVLEDPTKDLMEAEALEILQEHFPSTDPELLRQAAKDVVINTVNIMGDMVCLNIRGGHSNQVH